MQMTDLEGTGLIPAHAGKTHRAGSPAAGRRAHPRSRGENLARGHPPDHEQGLIPAHAGKTRPPACQVQGWAAHPRSRGENTYAGEDRNLALGSSPLTRGKLQRPTVTREGTRLIPAHAGKTGGVAAHCLAREAHPRSRGENPRRPVARGVGEGSSPLTRGKPRCGPARPLRLGLIPAHAGKTFSR